MSVQGKESIFYIKYLGDWFPISCETSSPMSEGIEMLNTTTRANGGWTTQVPTNQGYSINISALLIDDRDCPALLSYYKIREMKRNRDIIEWKRISLDGIYIDYGKAYITEISDSNTVGEEIAFSVSLSGFGKPLTDTDVQYILGESDTVSIGDVNNNLIETK